MPVQMKLSRIIMNDINHQQVMYLREVDGQREFPIVIGNYEATCIDRRVKGFVPVRPLTHDLVRAGIEALGGVLQDVYIHRLEEHTYYSSLRLRHGNELIEIDARPSDAVTVAVTYSPQLPIVIEEDVLLQSLQRQEPV